MAGMSPSLEPDPATNTANNTPKVLEGVVRRKCLSTTYNRKRMILAPHILYTRNGSLYMDAAVVSLENMLPREAKMGTYKLDGLKELTVLDRDFEISELFEPGAEKYQGETLMMVE
jgi:hypothetical protein